MTFAEYTACAGVSNSMLGALSRSPAHLQSYLANRPESTPEQTIGTHFHSMLLEPGSVKFAPRPDDYDGRKKASQQWAQDQEANGVTVCAPCVPKMVESVLHNESLRSAIETGDAEQSLFADFTLGGTVRRKGRLDLITAGTAIIDFKSSMNASRDAFARAIATNGYARQAAYYIDLAAANGIDKPDFVFVAVEKEPPYAVGIYQLDADSIGFGRKQYVDLLEIYIRCQDENKWPAYGDTVQLISLPYWATRGAAY